MLVCFLDLNGINFAKSYQGSETDIISNYVHITVFTPMSPKKRIGKRKIRSVPLPFPQEKMNFLDVSQKVPQISTVWCNVVESRHDQMWLKQGVQFKYMCFSLPENGLRIILSKKTQWTILATR